MSFLFVLGFISVLGQVILLRELNVAFYGVELVYTLAVGIWLFFTATGALLYRRTRRVPSFKQISLLFTLFAVCLPLDVAFIRAIRILFAGTPGAYLPLHSQVAALCLALLPIGLILGLLFQWTAKTYIGSGRSLAAAYVIESLGGIAGGIAATVLLKFGVQNFVLALICAAAAVFVSLLSFKGSVEICHWLSLILLAVLSLIFWKAPFVDRSMTAWNHPRLIKTCDSPYSRITVTYTDGQVSFFENDALIFETEGTDAEEFVHLAALQHPNPQRILVLGGGIKGTVHEILGHSPRTVDYVEYNPALLRFIEGNLPGPARKSLRSENVRLIESDPRHFLDQASSYDLILIGMSQPTSAQTNRFYTREFFSKCRAKLNKGGLIAFSLPSSENTWNKPLILRMVSICRAVKAVFPEVLVLPGTADIVIGSTTPLTGDLSILTSRFKARNIRGRIISENYIRYLYTEDRIAELAGKLASGTAPINTDMRPICYQYALLSWLSKLLPSSEWWSFSVSSFHINNFAWMIALSFPALLFSRAGWKIRRTVLAAIAGFAGMILETVLLLHFQTKNGILYQDIGILLTAFMAGLAFGAWIYEKGCKRISGSAGHAMLGGFILLSGLTGGCIGTGSGSGLVATASLLFLTGSFVGGIFAFAGSADDQTDAIAPLYAADLAGGCLGSLIATLALAPLAGLSISAYAMIPVLLLSTMLVARPRH